MPRWVDRIVDRHADRIAQKALQPFPAGTNNTDVAPLIEAMARGLTNSSSLGATVALPRLEPPAPFGPMRPPYPAAIDPPLDATGRPMPRVTQYPVGWNLPGAGQPRVAWTVLRHFADQVTVVRKCIDLRKNRLSSVDWSIGVKPEVVEAAARDQGTRKQAAAQDLAKSMQPDIDRLRTFWERPDRLRRLTFSEWLLELLEEHFVLDALSIYPHPDLAGDLHSFEVLDGSTIKPLLDNRGNPPQPPQPAYQQILYGFPRGEFALTDDSSATFSSDELIYRPRDRRTQSPYGYSPVEKALLDGDLYLKRYLWQRANYTDGTASTMYLKPDIAHTSAADWSIDTIRQYEELINSSLSGQTQDRHRARALPPGWATEFPPDFAERYHPDFDEYLIKVLCMPFGVMPTELGFTPHGGLGGKGHQQGEADSAERNADEPYIEWLTDILNELSRTYLEMPPELTFTFDLSDGEDTLASAQVAATRIGTAVSTLNDVRADDGEPLYDFDEANEPFLVTPNGPVFLRGLLAKEAAAATAVPVVPPPPDDSGGIIDPPAPGGQADELKAFSTYATRRIHRGGAWRPFEFHHVHEHDAGILNELGEHGEIDAIKAEVAELIKAPDLGKVRPAEWAGAADLQAIIAWVTPKLETALADIWDLGEIVRRWDALHTTKAVDPGVLASARALLDEQPLDTAAAVAALADLYGESYAAGGQAAKTELGATVDWTTWQPGYGAAAVEAWGADGGRGLAGLLAQAEVTIKSIAEDRLDDLAQVLGAALDQGLGIGTLTGQLRDVLDIPARAEIVARTETARAMTVASLDEYHQAGVTGQVWLLSDGACELCEENDDAGVIPIDDDFPNGDVPVHPNCVCAIAPAYLEET